MKQITIIYPQMTSPEENKLLASSREKKLLAHKMTSPEIATAVSTTSEKVTELTQSSFEENEDIEVKRNILMDKLDGLSEQLSQGIEQYHLLFGEEYSYIEAALMNIEYAEADELENLNEDNIEASALFGGFDPKDMESVKIYNELLIRLKAQNHISCQAHLLGFMEILSVFVINKESNKKLFKEDEFKRIIFESLDLNSSYQALLKRIFHIMDNAPMRAMEYSENLHKNHGNGISPELKSLAERIVNTLR